MDKRLEEIYKRLTDDKKRKTENEKAVLQEQLRGKDREFESYDKGVWDALKAIAETEVQDGN